MRRLIALTGAAMLTLTLTVPSAGASEAAGRDAAVAIVGEDLTTYPRADFQSKREVRCVARGLVDALGLRRLRAMGLDVADEEPPRLYVPHLRESERTTVARVYEG